jgi:hypothetical protein
MQTSSTSRIFSLIIALAFCIIMPVVGYLKIGLPPVVIIGSSATVGFLFLYFT